MSIWDDITSGINTAVQGTTDLVTGGPENIVRRQELDRLKQQQQNLIQTYNDQKSQTTAWISPVNNTASIVTSILQRTSEYVQGILFSYNTVLEMGSINVPMITAIEKAGLSPHKLLDLGLPSELGGVPASLIPGLNTVSMVEGIINSFADSATLEEQVDKVQDQNNQIQAAIASEQQLRENLLTLRDYLLGIGTQALTVYERTTGVQFNPMPLRGDTPQDLATLNDQMVQMCDRLEKVNGNTFMIFRVLINLIQSGKVEGGVATDAQLDYLAQKLLVIESVSEAFPDQDALRQFLANFFQGQLAIAPTLLNLPPIPDNIKQLVSETPSEKEIFDLNSPKYDPPGDLDLNDLP